MQLTAGMLVSGVIRYGCRPDDPVSADVGSMVHIICLPVCRGGQLVKSKRSWKATACLGRIKIAYSRFEDGFVSTDADRRS